MGWFLQPLGLLALLGIPAVIALHLFRRRFAPRRVSALFLWEAADRTAVSGRTVERLHRNPSFWFELLAAAFLGLLCAGPRLPWTQPARHLVVVLDGSASMLASDGARTFRDAALQEVTARIEQLPRRSRVTVIQSGSPPRLLTGPAAFPAEATARLADFRPGIGRHDLGPALALAQEIAGNAAVLLVTDDYAPDRFAPELELRSVGTAQDNVGFTHVARTREKGQEKAFVTIASFSTRAERRRLTLRAAEQVVATRDVALAPGERLHFSFDLPDRTPTLEATLDELADAATRSAANATADALPVDDHAWLAPIAPRVVALACTLEPALAVALGLMSRPDAPSRVDRWCALVNDAVARPEAEAHLVVAAAAATGAAAWSLVVPPCADAERRDLIGPFLIEKRHPLLRGLTLDGIVWSLPVGHSWSGAPLISAGDLPMLTEETVGERHGFTLAFDPARSSLQRSPDWPILLVNLAEMRRAELPGPERTNLSTGDAFVARGAGEGIFTVRALVATARGEPGAPAEREVTARGTLVIDELQQPALYRAEASDGRRYDFAVNALDAAESDLRALRPGRRPSALALAELAASFSGVDLTLLLLVLAVLLADWLYLSRVGGR